MIRNEFVGREVGKALGLIEKVDIEQGEFEWREFMHIRAVLDATKPLLCRKKMNIGLLAPVFS